jgi:hypothetical protein
MDSGHLETKFSAVLYGFYYSIRTSARVVMFIGDSYRLPFHSEAQYAHNDKRREYFSLGLGVLL